MNRLSAFLAATVAFGLLLWAGCDSTGPSAESGTLELRMIDGSAGSTEAFLTSSEPSAKSHVADNLQEAIVPITEVQIVPAEDTSEEDGGIEVLLEETFEVDLVDLQTGLDTTVAETEVPAGTYAQIRLITADQASVTFEDGTQRDVMIASGQQTGLKINFDPLTIESADDRAEITLDFNVEESLEGSRQGKLVITPTIEAIVETVSVGS